MKKFSVESILFSLLVCSCMLLLNACSGKSKTKSILEHAAEGINKNCPVTLDEYTVLTDCQAKDDNVLQYNYFLDFDKLPGNTSVEEFGKRMKSYVVNGIKTAPDMAELRNHGVVFEYVYKKQNGSVFLQFEVTPEDYR